MLISRVFLVPALIGIEVQPMDVCGQDRQWGFAGLHYCCYYYYYCMLLMGSLVLTSLSSECYECEVGVGGWGNGLCMELAVIRSEIQYIHMLHLALVI